MIADEAHKTAGDGKSMSYCLHDENIPVSKRIFFTATPRHYVAGQDDDEAEMVSMDDEDLYGPRAFTLSFRDAAAEWIIVPYKVIISVVDSTRLDAHGLARGQVYRAGKTHDATTLAHQVALAQAVRAHDLQRVMSFHSRVAQASAFVESDVHGAALAEMLPQFRLLHISGAMKSSQRQEVMQAFAAQGKALISNARCLTEGVDVPSVDMVAFIDPKKSRVDIAQAAGRAMRPAPGKPTGYVFVPLLLSPRQGETLAQAAERGNFTDVVATLHAMQEVDEFLGDALRSALPKGDETRSTREMDDRVEILLPDGEFIDMQELRDAIRVQVLRRAVSGWEQGLEEAREYRRVHGHLRVPQSHTTASGFRLGEWIRNRRKDLKAGRLEPDRKAALDELGMVWAAPQSAPSPSAEPPTALPQQAAAQVQQRFRAASIQHAAACETDNEIEDDEDGRDGDGEDETQPRYATQRGG